MQKRRPALKAASPAVFSAGRQGDYNRFLNCWWEESGRKSPVAESKTPPIPARSLAIYGALVNQLEAELARGVALHGYGIA
jgi:hypothetical protein